MSELLLTANVSPAGVAKLATPLGNCEPLTNVASNLAAY